MSNMGEELLTLLKQESQGDRESLGRVWRKKYYPAVLSFLLLIIFLTALSLLFEWGPFQKTKTFLYWDRSPIKGFVLLKLRGKLMFPYSSESSTLPVSLFTNKSELLVGKAYVHPSQFFGDEYYSFSLHPRDMALILDESLWPLKVLPFAQDTIRGAVGSYDD